MGRAKMRLLAASSAALLAGGVFATASAQAAINAKHHAGTKASAVTGSNPLRFKVCGVSEGAGCEFVWDFYVQSKTWVSEEDSEVGGSFEKVGKLAYVVRYEDGYADGCEIQAQKARLFAPITGGFYCEGELLEELAEVKLQL
jgi:hypothetical protein